MKPETALGTATKAPLARAPGRRGFGIAVAPTILPLVIWLAFSLSAVAQHQFQYTTNGGGVTITGYTGRGGALKLPELLDGLPVTRIGAYAFSGQSTLKSVTIPKGVTDIENWTFDFVLGAFAGCTNLTEINVDPLNRSYSSVDGVLFNKRQTTLLACPAGKGGSYSMPDSITRVVAGAFAGCASLTSVTISDRVIYLGDRAFSGCSGVTNITIPNVVRIADGAFSDCSGLTHVTISDSVTGIGDGAFSGCGALTRITIPNSVTNIGGWAFSGCESLTGITISQNVTFIGDRAFYGSGRLAAVTVDPLNSVYSGVDGVLFDKSQTTLLAFPGGKGGSYSIPETVTHVERGAFSQCIKLTTVSIPNSVTSIGDNAFSGCDRLISVGLPNYLTRIQPATFENCTSLTSVTIPERVTNIGGGAFAGCTALWSVTIDGVTTIGDSAFAGCTSLSSLRIPTSVTRIESAAFQSCSDLTNVTIPSSLTSIGGAVFYGCDNLQEVRFEGNAPGGLSVPSILKATQPTVYYLPGTVGWGSTFSGRPTALWQPVVQAVTQGFGLQNNPFGFTITWGSEMVIVVEATTSLMAPIWSALGTNTLTDGTSYFSDPDWVNHSDRFYRLRLP